MAKATANGTVAGVHSSRTRSVIHLSLCDSLPAYGPIADMTFSLSKLGVRIYFHLVPYGADILTFSIWACYLFDDRPFMLIGTIRPRTGSRHGERSPWRFYSFPGTRRPLVPVLLLSPLIVLDVQRDLPVRTKRKLHVLGGARGIWSIPVRQSHRVNGTSYEKASGGLFAGENDTIVISTDANPSPGVSRVRYSLTPRDRMS